MNIRLTANLSSFYANLLGVWVSVNICNNLPGGYLDEYLPCAYLYGNSPGVSQVRVKAYDNGSPPREDIAVVKVTVNRNLNPPRFDGGEQTKEIFYTQPLGEPIVTVHARDADKQVCAHAIGSSNILSS